MPGVSPDTARLLRRDHAWTRIRLDRQSLHIPSRVFGLRGFKLIKKSRKNRVFVISRSENGRAEPWILLSPPKESKREMSGSSAKNFPRRKIEGMLWGRFEMETKEQGGSHTGRGSAFDTNLLFQEADTSRLPT